LSGEWWRLLTSCFLHIGIIHLGFNMWCLWSLGELAERLYGHVTFACIYLLCGVGGSLASVWWHSSPIVSAGASGAIFGIAGAVIASIKLGEFASSVMAQSVLRSLMAFVGYNVVFGLLTGVTDNACHGGGLVVGLLLGALIAKVAPQPRLMPRLVVMALIAILLAGGTVALERSRPYRLLRMEGRVSTGNSLAQVGESSQPGTTPGCVAGDVFCKSGLQSVACTSATLL
jgi:rhomboid protease GluP